MHMFLTLNFARITRQKSEFYPRILSSKLRIILSFNSIAGITRVYTATHMSSLLSSASATHVALDNINQPVVEIKP